MGNGCMNGNKNVYYQARKEATRYNEILSSRERTAELLGVSQSTLADYELGITKIVPVDKVVLMADLYNCPELKTGYCKHECPIGMHRPLATTINGIEGVALKIIRILDFNELKNVEKSLVLIAEDGIISEDEKPTLRRIIDNFDEMSLAISELKLIGEKVLKGK